MCFAIDNLFQIGSYIEHEQHIKSIWRSARIVTLEKAALQLPTKTIQRWNPVGWHSERLTLCSYLLAEQSRVARCHMAPGYTERHSHTHRHTYRHTLAFMTCSPNALPQVQRSQERWTRGWSQVSLRYIINTGVKAGNMIPLEFVNWSTFGGLLFVNTKMFVFHC